MSLTAAGLQELYPEFGSVADAYIEAWLNQSAALHTEASWGSGYELGMYAWTAHHLKLFPAGGTGDGGVRGAVTAESVGGISASYSDPSGGITAAADAFFRQSSYGLAYLAIRRTRALGRARVVSMA